LLAAGYVEAARFWGGQPFTLLRASQMFPVAAMTRDQVDLALREEAGKRIVSANRTNRSEFLNRYARST
jgi:hypothetical protein